jgi:methionine synthase / methylenetetrahydrofolate reductase(NADPH)
MSLERLRKSVPGRGTPLLCLEVNPPRGVDLAPLFHRLDGQLDGIDFLNVTDSALAKMKMGALPCAGLLRQRYGVEPFVNLACRDRNVIALQGDLLAGWALGIRSVVALTGDAVTIGDMPECKGVFEVNSIGLLQIIQKLNEGKDLAGHTLHGMPAFCPGVVVNPNARNIGAEIKRLRKKADAGACYALSQPVFDEIQSVQFFKEAVHCGVPLFLGLLPIKSVESAKSLSSIPGIKLSDSILERLQKSEQGDLADFSIRHCLELARLNREYVCGFHVVCGATPKLGLRLARELIQALGSLTREEGG